LQAYSDEEMPALSSMHIKSMITLRSNSTSGSLGSKKKTKKERKSKHFFQ